MDKKEIIENAKNDAVGYHEYIAFIESLHEKKKATSFQDNSKYFEHSLMSLTRMNRIYKKLELSNDSINILKSIQAKQNWILITESWCGDASQTVPVIAKMSQVTDKIDLKIVLRDSNPEFMDLYKTNGSISIPILVLFDESWNELAVWGPRPEPAQAKVLEYKKLPDDKKPAYSELSHDLQKWYNSDKGKTTQEEVLKLINSISEVQI
ncbi:thioredoxin family protein [Reichenbachiella versicolor]|uniref:thioredoxin family protein n=1 Tax=Reichenbachiella versicolor TaxID=1821036 RepID=UPI0013A546C4|nr:thioredoxin family protein [Reichenbachiella versicolor]